MRTRVKICGITRPEDGQAAARAGADAIGLVFYEQSPRCVDILQAQEICAILPPFVTVVGLFVNAGRERVAAVLEALPVDLLQFHGQECADYCAQHRRPWIRAIRMKPETDVLAEQAAYAGGRGLLLDAYRPGVPGGTGETFDWARIPPMVGPQITLAGGLDPGNVGAAVRAVRPYAVDVSGGVEVEKGIKDPDKIKAFMHEVHNAEQ